MCRVLKKIIESVFTMYNKFNTTVETIKTSSDSLFQKWGELSKEFGEDLDQVGDSKELKGNIENRIDFIKSVLVGLSEGSIPRIKEEKEIELFEKIFDLKDSPNNISQSSIIIIGISYPLRNFIKSGLIAKGPAFFSRHFSETIFFISYGISENLNILFFLYPRSL